ncbi:MAG: dinitrogenase iron-molybdenum cofactor biosynthesis protein [Firmicutes bacterium HGW-Firmicutes-2]|nr:MAG: dinitrogenase iron-molybdenum cofactor biosynthesis protein [Firmicutes bacterium HGW-Firmicutes-2]
MMKVAVASSDGIVVNAHFGRTPKFLIFELSHKEIRFIENRENAPGCGQLNEPLGTMEETCNLIKDCDIVIVAQIGPAMIKQLQEMGIIAMKKPNLIENALLEIQENEILERRQI